jgi:hypothetical protein
MQPKLMFINNGHQFACHLPLNPAALPLLLLLLLLLPHLCADRSLVVKCFLEAACSHGALEA